MAARDERVGLEVRGHGGQGHEADAGGSCGRETQLVDEAGQGVVFEGEGPAGDALVLDGEVLDAGGVVEVADLCAFGDSGGGEG